jgi:hypothetical protein
MAQGQPGLAQHLSAELPAAERPWQALAGGAHADPRRALHAWPMGYPVTTLTARPGKVAARCRPGGPQFACTGNNPVSTNRPCRPPPYA